MNKLMRLRCTLHSCFTPRILNEYTELYTELYTSRPTKLTNDVTFLQAMRAWAKNNLPNESSMSYSELCADATVTQHVRDEIAKFAKSNGLNSLETPKAVHLSAEAFSIENDLLTPTMKSKRPKLQKYFGEQMRKLYQEA